MWFQAVKGESGSEVAPTPPTTFSCLLAPSLSFLPLSPASFSLNELAFTMPNIAPIQGMLKRSVRPLFSPSPSTANYDRKPPHSNRLSPTSASASRAVSPAATPSVRPPLSLSLSLQPLSFLRSFPSASSPLADPLSTHTGYGHHIANGECSSESLTRRVEPSVGSRTNGDEQR
jgi:hypothetical protein